MNRRLFKGDHPDLAASINNMAYFYDGRGNYEQAEALYKEALEMNRRLYKGDHPDLASSIGRMANFYKAIGDFKQAKPLYKEELEMKRRLFKGDNSDLASSIDNIAVFYDAIGNYKQAEPLHKEALEMYRRLFKGDHPDLATSINNMAYFYDATGDYKMAEPLHKEALEMSRHLFKGDHPDFATNINNMASFYETMGDYKHAEPLYIEALEMCRRIFKGDHPDLAMKINNMAAFYKGRGEYNQAESLYKESLEMRRHLFKGDHPDLENSINNMAVFCTDRGDYKQAEILHKESLEMSRRIFKGDHPLLAQSINNMAFFYNTRGDYKQAELLFKEALEMRRHLFKVDHPKLAESIHNMGYFYIGIGEDKTAEPFLNEALEMKRRLFKGDHPDLASSIVNMAYIDNARGDYKLAESLYKEALEMRRHLFKGDHPDLANSIVNMAYFYNARGDYKLAEPLYKDALEMKRRLFKRDHPDLANSIVNMAYFYNARGDNNQAELLFNEALEVYKNMLNNYFPSLSEKEKKLFWNIVSSNFERFNTFAVSRAKENPFILCNLYDTRLYTKAILMNSGNRIKSRILNSGDSLLIGNYRKWSDKKAFLVKLYKMTNEELKKKNFNIDSVENNVNNLEKELSLKSEAFKQSFENKKVTWKSIQTLLKPDEAAVEVFRFRYFDKNRFTDTVYYAFLIVNDQTDDHPDLVLIENGKELENEFYNEYRKNTGNKAKDNKSFERYWAKLYEKIKGYKKVFFSSDGVYNKLNPTTFMLPDGKYLLDIQDIQQVNSTKDLLLGYYQNKQETNIYNSALLIGNPNFNLSEEELKIASRKIRSKADEEKSYEPMASTRGISLSKLPGTEKEINDIEKFLKGKKWEVSSYLGDNALKTAIRTANNPRVLHIATHGLFLEDVKRESIELFGFSEKKMIENPLLRSGLFFTGADNYLKKENSNMDNEEDNGILTAYEAMNLDLDKTELVVLSACETGLGEIQNGEGVFGLRRAFQQAGAKTVMMSLWKVDDSATQELMSSFYKNWVTGMTKRDAFSKAQQEVKAKYKEPYYWGSFVMVGE